MGYSDGDKVGYRVVTVMVTGWDSDGDRVGYSGGGQ